MGMTPYLQLQALALLTGSYAALHTGAPGPDGTSSELADANYARQPVSFPYGSDADSDGVYQIANDAEVVYPALAAAATVQYYSLWNSSSGGNCLVTVQLTSPMAVALGGVARFPIGELIIKGVTA